MRFFFRVWGRRLYAIFYRRIFVTNNEPECTHCYTVEGNRFWGWRTYCMDCDRNFPHPDERYPPKQPPAPILRLPNSALRDD
jgi:hypothetical protein